MCCTGHQQNMTRIPETWRNANSVGWGASYSPGRTYCHLHHEFLVWLHQGPRARRTVFSNNSPFTCSVCTDHLKMRRVSDKSCKGTFDNFFFSLENCAVHETLWRNTVEADRQQMAIRCMCFACWIPKATNTHSKYVILTAFPLKQLLHERVSALCYIYIACLIRSVVRFYFWKWYFKGCY